jgi:hypothetical protein
LAKATASWALRISGFGNDFNQRCTGAVEINAGIRLTEVALVEGFTRVLFEVSMMNADGFFTAIC